MFHRHLPVIIRPQMNQRRSSSSTIAELTREARRGEVAGGREGRQLPRILEVVPAEADHVAPGDRVAGAARRPCAPASARFRDRSGRRAGPGTNRPACMLTISSRCPSSRNLRRSSRGPGSTHVEGDRIRAAKFVAEVLRDHREVDAELAQPGANPLDQDSDVHLGEAHVTVEVTLGGAERFEFPLDAEGHALRPLRPRPGDPPPDA